MSASRYLSVSPVLAALILTACSAVPTEDADTMESASALRKCPPTDPDYPTCIPEPDGCAGATGSLNATPPSINSGQSTTLSWTVQAPAGCQNTLTLSSQPVALSGSKVIAPLSSTPYQLRLGKKTLATVNVNVVLPPTVRINGNTADWRRLLIQAVGTPNTRVVLGSDVDMDMTGFENIYVRDGVTLTSEAPPPVLSQGIGSLVYFPGGPFGDLPPARNAQTLGPRLYTTSRPKPLFNIECNSDHTIWGDNVRFIGFRLQGPHPNTEEGDDNLERGIQINSCVGVEIVNMELSGFSGQAVYIEDPQVRQFNPDAVKVTGSYIHNNQHVSGNGYGVETGAGAYAKIERNVFDFNRHAIASSGAPGTGYMADHNLVLKGGGVHAKWYNEFTHLFDVHGDANCPDIPGNQHTWNCGNAGDQYWMTNNAFQYTQDLSIKLRGVPRVAANIYGNVFAQGSIDDAIETKGSTNVSVGPNRTGVDPFGNYGVCDFDGDGKDDLFLATGASWWYSSAGKMNWVYLNSHTELLSEVGLGDFNGDKRCDVFARNTGTGAWEISSGGNSPWTALPGTYSVPFEELRFGDFNGDKITDVFRRAPDGQWWVTSPGIFGWTALQSSGIPLKDLRFGDFNGDGITDVLGRNGGKWAVSLSGTSSWTPWGPLSDGPDGLVVADVDGLPGDDVLRYVATSPLSGHWDVSSGGRTAWKQFAALSWPSSITTQALQPAYRVRSIFGRFDAFANADLLAIDYTRMGRIFSAGHSNFGAHSLYAY